MADTLLKEPENFEDAGFTYSNFDHEMPKEADSTLRSGKHFMEHTAWDHFGIVWFADGEFHERVMRYGSHVETLSAPTLSDLICEVNSEYGCD